MSIKLVILDVDGVIKEERDPYIYLHRHLGTLDAGERHLADFLAGRISYDEFAQRDAGEWRGRSVAEIKAILRQNPYVPGAHELAQGLHHRGIPFILLSSGFNLHVEDVAADLDAVEYICNELDHDGRVLLGTMTVRVPWGGKAEIVRDILQRWRVEPETCLAVGDSGGDIPAFQEVGHAIAVRPSRPEVAQAAHLTLPDLTGVLDYVDQAQTASRFRP
ncbi:MAG: HAD-IB family phosphatase [Chloroflexi bacterium]|nr:HAD-IB family phosphatase [Chloroflexota bacterium]